MAINLQNMAIQENLQPRLVVIGVGGAGSNAVNNMINKNLEGIDFVVANTDAQSLDLSLASRKIQLGLELTKGLGAGSKPEVGRAAAEEAIADIRAALEHCNMLFITAGMGGGTGTGAAPVVAEIAKDMGILTVGVVTRPFEFEGSKRKKLASEGIRELQKHVGTLIVIPNQNLFRIAGDNTTFTEAFQMADDVLHHGVRGITELIVVPGLINLDFADIKTVMGEMGKAMMGTGEAEGEKRAIEAAEKAISNPLLEDITMEGATQVLINITGGHDVTLYEIDHAVNRIRKEVHEDAHIHFGTAFDDNLQGRLRLSVVATGIETPEMQSGTTANGFSYGNKFNTIINKSPHSLNTAPAHQDADDETSSDFISNTNTQAIDDDALPAFVSADEVVSEPPSAHIDEASEPESLVPDNSDATSQTQAPSEDISSPDATSSPDNADDNADIDNEPAKTPPPKMEDVLEQSSLFTDSAHDTAQTLEEHRSDTQADAQPDQEVADSNQDITKRDDAFIPHNVKKNLIPSDAPLEEQPQAVQDFDQMDSAPKPTKGNFFSRIMNGSFISQQAQGEVEEQTTNAHFVSPLERLRQEKNTHSLRLEETEKDDDEDILSIPAFLRRQAN